MDERFEVEVLACCPECGCSFNDWIPINVDYHFLFKNSNGQPKNSEGEKSNE
jgi:hypothetical protein